MKHIKKFNEDKKPKGKIVKKLDYHDMMKYLEKKYKFESREFSGIPSTHKDSNKSFEPYMDYWHYICSVNDGLSNGSFIYIPKEVDNSGELTPQNRIDNYKFMKKEFGDDRKMIKNLDELIAREEEALKNPKHDPWKNWKQQITDLIFKEFGEYAKDDYIKFWVEW